MKFLDPDAYQPAARRLYEALSAKLRAAVPAARIEHIGASSIEGTVSKGDLDLYVGVAPEAFEESVRAIESVGFRIKQGTLRTGSLCPFESADHPLDVGVQLVAHGSRFEFFLTFRDRMNRSERLREEYNRMKRSCEALDADAYREVKSRFIEAVLGSEG